MDCFRPAEFVVVVVALLSHDEAKQVLEHLVVGLGVEVEVAGGVEEIFELFWETLNRLK